MMEENTHIPKQEFTNPPSSLEPNALKQDVEESLLYSKYAEDGPKKSKWWKTLIFIIVGVLILGGIGYAGYWGYSTYITTSPEKVLFKSLQKMRDLDTVAYEGVVKIKIPLDMGSLGEDSVGIFGDILTGDSFETSFTFIGATDSSDKENNKDKLDMELTAGDMFTVGLQVLGIKDTIYFNFNKIPALFSMFMTVSDFKDKWIKYEVGKPLETTLDLPEFDSEKDEEEMERIVEILKRDIYTIFKVKQDYGVETLDDVDGKLFHYEIGFNRVNTELLLNNIKDVVEEDKKGGFDEAIEEMDDEFWVEVEKRSFDVWIGRTDYYFKKLEFKTNFDSPNKPDSGDVGFIFSLLIKDFNKPVEIQEPEEFTTVEEFLENMMGGFIGTALGNAKAKSRDARRISDIKQVQTALEIYYMDYNKYPAVSNPVVLGKENFQVLCDSGFQTTIESCEGTIYMAQIPSNPEPGAQDYLYNFMSENDYIITFVIEEPTAGFKEGKLEANPSGFHQPTLVEQELDMDDFFEEEDLFDDEIESGDSDGDGLSNEEEIIIWGTDPNNSDTDGDGYLDGDEVDKGYNPNGEGKL